MATFYIFKHESEGGMAVIQSSLLTMAQNYFGRCVYTDLEERL